MHTSIRGKEAVMCVRLELLTHSALRNNNWILGVFVRAFPGKTYSE